MYLGIDIGSSSSKAILLNAQKEIAAFCVVNRGTGTDGMNEVLAEACSAAQITADDILYTVATGYGRFSCGMADRQLTEISCHAKGVFFLTEGTRTIIDIGGQDAKVIKIDEKGRTINFAMNEKCAAGTGRFLEVMSRVLDCPLDQLSQLAESSLSEVAISSVCTVFAESEVISQLAAGARREDVARGAHRAIAKRVAGLCKRVGYSPKVVMTGGVALNADMIESMGSELGVRVEACPHPQLAGAAGAAVFAWEAARREGLQTGRR